MVTRTPAAARIWRSPLHNRPLEGQVGRRERRTSISAHMLYRSLPCGDVFGEKGGIGTDARQERRA